MSKNTDIQYRIHTNFILVMILLLLSLVFFVLTPFLSTLFIAAVIVSATFPLHKFIRRYIPTPILGAFITFITILCLFITPVILLGRELLQEASGVSVQMANAANQLPDFFNQVLVKIATYLPADSPLQQSLSINNLSQIGANAAGELSSVLVKSATGFLAGVSLFFLHTLIFLFALFYLYLDGERLIKYVKALLPLAEKQKDQLVQKTSDLMQSIIYGLFGAAIAQGSLVGIGMALVGITNPIFWGAIAIALAPVPYLGVGLIWVPTAAWLFSTGQWAKGIFFCAWCLVFVINIDNIIKPYLIGARSLLHPFAVMLVIIGGVLTMGFKGLVFGPLLLTLLLAFLHIYQLEFGTTKKSTKSKK